MWSMSSTPVPGITCADKMCIRDSLILCGKQTTDGDTAQVGPAIAEHMGIPHAAWVSRIEAETNGVVVEQQLQDVIETVRMPFPCLVTVEQDIYMPRLPSLKTARRVADRPVHVMGLDSFLDTDPEHYGLSGRDRKSTRLNSSHSGESRMPSSA